jgi:hypothetical protein
LDASKPSSGAAISSKWTPEEKVPKYSKLIQIPSAGRDGEAERTVNTKNKQTTELIPRQLPQHTKRNKTGT